MFILKIFLLSMVLLYSFSSYAFDYTRFINTSNCDQILKNNGYYQTCYSYRAKMAIYVHYTLDGGLVNVYNIKKRPSFKSDKKIPEKYRMSASDYTRNNRSADRGHLAPDASFDYNQDALNSVYKMSNIIPQYKRVNRVTWKKVEILERKMAINLGRVEVLNGVFYDKDRTFSNGALYPLSFWKMIYNDNISRCFIYKNDKISKTESKNDKLNNHEIDCLNITNP